MVAPYDLKGQRYFGKGKGGVYSLVPGKPAHTTLHDLSRVYTVGFYLYIIVLQILV